MLVWYAPELCLLIFEIWLVELDRYWPDTDHSSHDVEESYWSSFLLTGSPQDWTLCFSLKCSDENGTGAFQNRNRQGGWWTHWIQTAPVALDRVDLNCYCDYYYPASLVLRSRDKGVVGFDRTLVQAPGTCAPWSLPSCSDWLETGDHGLKEGDSDSQDDLLVQQILDSLEMLLLFVVGQELLLLQLATKWLMKDKIICSYEWNDGCDQWCKMSLNRGATEYCTWSEPKIFGTIPKCLPTTLILC